MRPSTACQLKEMIMRAFLGSTTGLIGSLLIAAVGGLLLLSHTGHVLLALPYLILLACPLMHVLHRGHHHHGPKREPSLDSKPPSNTPKEQP